MPLYEYECLECADRFEKIQRVGDSPVSECPKCSGEVRRLLGVPALQFKGSGWYVTDYGKGNGKGAKGRSDADGRKAAGESSSASARSDSTTEISSAKKEPKKATAKAS